jgi:ribonuclease-3 family protein
MVDLKANCHLMNGADLAYIGDAYYELMIRKYLLSKGITKNKELQKKSIMYVSAHAHQIICDRILSTFSLEEVNVFKRGRNGAPHNHRKNLNYAEYGTSSGFEAVIGYWYLKENFDRLKEIIDLSIKIVEEKINE